MDRIYLFISIWAFVGFIVAFVRTVDFNGFSGLTTIQIIVISLVIGPTWLLVGIIWAVIMTGKKIYELWNLLGEIGEKH